MTVPYHKVLTLTVPAAVATGISLSQSGTAAVPLLINGSLATAGVANLVTPQRVIVTSAGNDSGITFSIIGTDRYGRPQTEVLTGGNVAAARTSHDFLTIKSITPSGNTASTVTAGTTAVASTAPLIVDMVINPAQYGCGTVVSGTVNYTIEISLDDLAPAWDLANNAPTWYADPTFNAQTTNQNGNISGPCTMLRLTNNSGTGTSTARIIMPFIAGRA